MDHKYQRVSSNAVINTDMNALLAYKKRKKMMEDQNQRINKIESEIAEIKELLLRVLNKND